MDASQSPLVAPFAAKAQHEGVYTLITKRNGCASNPVTVTVSIDNKPGKPSLLRQSDPVRRANPSAGMQQPQCGPICMDFTKRQHHYYYHKFSDDQQCDNR